MTQTQEIVKEIIVLNRVKTINEDIEEFTGNVHIVLEDWYNADFPDRMERLRLSRTKDKKLFRLLMNCMRDKQVISLDFIKKEIIKEIVVNE